MTVPTLKCACGKHVYYFLARRWFFLRARSGPIACDTTPPCARGRTP